MTTAIKCIASDYSPGRRYTQVDRFNNAPLVRRKVTSPR